MHLTFLAFNTDCTTMLEVFHMGQMQLYCFMKSLNYFFGFFFKSYVFGYVWKLSFAFIKGATNSPLVKKTKWPQTRRKTVLKGNISQC